MPDKAWKKRERDVAGFFDGQRTALSGGNGKVTRADVIHDKLFNRINLLDSPCIQLELTGACVAPPLSQ